jgi:hypothetical protein
LRQGGITYFGDPMIGLTPQHAGGIDLYMENLVGGLMSIAILCAIVYAFIKAVLAPIHQKLDRILALQEASREEATTRDPA